MKKKKTSIKIKPRKYTLNSKRKSKSKEAIAAVITILAALVLCVVGYGVGKPIVDYFQNKENSRPESSVPWTPPAEESDAPTTDSTEPQDTTPPVTEPVPTVPEKVKVESAYILPESAVLSSESLNSAIAAAKRSGAQAVAVTLKDSTGYFLYKTDIDGVAESNAVKGTLTAKQICDIIKKADMIPSARICTTKDHVTGVFAGENFILSDGTGVWHDASPAKGGKKWLSPFSEKTANYIGEICGEVSAAGFETVVLAETMFPMFHPSDYSIYLTDIPIADEDVRCAALWTVIDEAKSKAEANGAEVLLEMSAEELYSGSLLSTDAEPARDTEKLSGVKLLLDFNGSTKGYTDAKSFIAQTQGTYKNQEFAVRIKGSGFSAGALDEIKRAFTEAGIVVYTE